MLSHTPDAVGQRGQCPELCVCNRQHIHSLRVIASWTICECQGTNQSTACLSSQAGQPVRCLFLMFYSLNHPSCYLPKQNSNWFDKLLALQLSKSSHTVPPWLLELLVLSAFTHLLPNTQALTYPPLLLPLTLFSPTRCILIHLNLCQHSSNNPPFPLSTFLLQPAKHFPFRKHWQPRGT